MRAEAIAAKMTANLLILFTLAFFPALMAFSAWSDLFSMTISNRVSLALVAAYPILAFGLGVPLAAIAINLTCGMAILVLTFFMFTRGWIGGGDAKLAAATALWLGWTLMAEYGLVVSILGGALTLGVLFSRKTVLPHWAVGQAWIARLHNPANGVPYGIALAIAGLALYPESQIWKAAAGF
jgi:prepilin peptidase CpaA